MSLRVNLLKPEELRYQGPVSRQFIITLVGSALALIFVLGILVTIQRQYALSKNLSWAREEWIKVEPRYKKDQAEQQKMFDNEALLKELNLWGSTRLQWGSLLVELQAIVPPTIQLTRMAVRSEWVFKKPPAAAAAAEPAPEAAKGENATATAEPPPAPAATPARKVEVTLEGRAAGELADEVVVQFVKSFRDAPAYQPLFEAVKLQRMLRDTAGKDTEDKLADRIFEIHGQFFERELK